MLQQQAQQFKLLVGEGHFLSGHPHHMALGADEEVPHPVILGLLLLLGPAEHRPHPGHQLHHAEGFGDEVIRPAVQAHHPVILRVLGGQHDHRQPLGGRRGPQLLEDGQAVLLRQHDVQQHQGWLRPLHGLPEIGRTVEPLGLIALAAQCINHQFADAVVILQQKDSFHGGSSSFHLTVSLQQSTDEM